MVSFTNPGVLGTPSQFRRHFEAPILAGREPDADDATQVAHPSALPQAPVDNHSKIKQISHSCYICCLLACSHSVRLWARKDTSVVAPNRKDLFEAAMPNI